jgi:hypothetical protein
MKFWCASIYEPFVCLCWIELNAQDDKLWPRLWWSYVVYPSNQPGVLGKAPVR